MDTYDKLAKERGYHEMPTELQQSMNSAASSIASIDFDDHTKKKLVEALVFGSEATLKKLLELGVTPMKHYSLIEKCMGLLDQRNGTQEEKNGAAEVLMENYRRGDFYEKMMRNEQENA